MRTAINTLFALITTLITALNPIARSVENISEGVEAGSRIFKKSVINFENELDKEALLRAKKLELNVVDV